MATDWLSSRSKSTKAWRSWLGAQAVHRIAPFGPGDGDDVTGPSCSTDTVSVR
jgi:hypothetical protein